MYVSLVLMKVTKVAQVCVVNFLITLAVVTDN